jgi:hypothetical protein
MGQIIGAKLDKKVNQKAQATQQRNDGIALAALAQRSIEDQGRSMHRILASLLQLTDLGREAFTATVETIRAAANDKVKGAKKANDPDLPKIIKARNSATVRYSEFIAFLKAIALGFEPDMNETYADIIGACQALLKSTGSSSQGAKKRGFLEKMGEMIAEMHPTAEQCKVAADQLMAHIAILEKAQKAAAEVQAQQTHAAEALKKIVVPKHARHAKTTATHGKTVLFAPEQALVQ